MSLDTSYGSVQALPVQGEEVPVQARQCRAARSLLGWTQKVLSQKAGVSQVTIIGFENELTKPTRATLTVIRQALEKGGVEFWNDEQPGVRMKKGRRK
jgi:transcriptional regulator with XRE-family HTH domain